MKKWKIVAWIISIVLFGIVFSNLFLSQENLQEFHYSKNETMINISLLTNKESYNQGELIDMNVSIYSFDAFENVTIRVEGIKSRFGRNYLYLEKIVNLTPGQNTIVFSAHMPYCSACSGISPGTYQINASVSFEDKILAYFTKNIVLEG